MSLYFLFSHIIFLFLLPDKLNFLFPCLFYFPLFFTSFRTIWYFEDDRWKRKFETVINAGLDNINNSFKFPFPSVIFEVPNGSKRCKKSIKLNRQGDEKLNLSGKKKREII